MTKTEQRQMLKGKAFNDIQRIFHPKSKWKPDEFPRDESNPEKRDYEVRCIMETYYFQDYSEDKSKTTWKIHASTNGLKLPE